MNRTLAPLGRVTASNDAFGYPANYIYHFGYGEGEYIDTWCTNAESDRDPHIEMELTSPVLITQILFSGRTGTSGLFHATNLTLEYSPPDNKTILNYYTTESGDIKVRFFHVNTLFHVLYLCYACIDYPTVLCCTRLEHLGTTGATFAD